MDKGESEGGEVGKVESDSASRKMTSRRTKDRLQKTGRTTTERAFTPQCPGC